MTVTFLFDGSCCWFSFMCYRATATGKFTHLNVLAPACVPQSPCVTSAYASKCQEKMLFIPTIEGLKHAITFTWPTRQFKPSRQRTIWSEHDHHTQSAHLVWHWFTRSTHQLPSSCKITELRTKHNGIHLCTDAFYAKQWSSKLK